MKAPATSRPTETFKQRDHPGRQQMSPLSPAGGSYKAQRRRRPSRRPRPARSRRHRPPPRVRRAPIGRARRSVEQLTGDEHQHQGGREDHATLEAAAGRQVTVRDDVATEHQHRAPPAPPRALATDLTQASARASAARLRRPGGRRALVALGAQQHRAAGRRHEQDELLAEGVKAAVVERQRGHQVSGGGAGPAPRAASSSRRPRGNGTGARQSRRTPKRDPPPITSAAARNSVVRAGRLTSPPCRSLGSSSLLDLGQREQEHQRKQHDARPRRSSTAPRRGPEKA